MKKIIIAACLVILATSICKAQSNAAQKTVANWGETVRGVQLSINVTNSAIDSGSTAIVFIQIQNSSTNVISMVEEGETRDFIITLKDSSGAETQLTPDTSRWRHTFRISIKIEPGETRQWKIPVTISKDIKPGEYTLKAATNHVGFKLVSNLLRIQVK